MKLEALSITKFVVVSLSLIFVAALGELAAQPSSIRDITDNKYALESLLMGIKSENYGVRRSSIYFAGKYRIAETEETLIEQLEREQNPDNRVLIALVLYKLQSEDGLMAVKKMAASDGDEIGRAEFSLGQRQSGRVRTDRAQRDPGQTHAS